MAQSVPSAAQSVTSGAREQGGAAAEVASTEVVDTEAKEAPRSVHSSAELLEVIQGRESDAPMCFTCGTKMRPAGSCHVCEGCGSTSGCS